ncbi:hypothetical protein ABT063_49515 [Streptomyces sp. NPDC002838]|uniref:hypothetical protein n=1 Tax=Streptomyces sp. NPDC002838 TaxID=3154436 RepID=UPI00331C8DDC
MSSIPSAPELPLALWWVVAIVVSVGCVTFYRSVAANRTQEMMSIAGILVALFGVIIFGASHRFHLEQLLPMYSSAVAAIWFAGVGHRPELRELYRISAESGDQHVRMSRPLTLQATASFAIILSLGVWFAARA